MKLNIANLGKVGKLCYLLHVLDDYVHHAEDMARLRTPTGSAAVLRVPILLVSQH